MSKANASLFYEFLFNISDNEPNCNGEKRDLYNLMSIEFNIY